MLTPAAPRFGYARLLVRPSVGRARQPDTESSYNALKVQDVGETESLYDNDHFYICCYEGEVPEVSHKLGIPAHDFQPYEEGDIPAYYYKFDAPNLNTQVRHLNKLVSQNQEPSHPEVQKLFDQAMRAINFDYTHSDGWPKKVFNVTYWKPQSEFVGMYTGDKVIWELSNRGLFFEN